YRLRRESLAGGALLDLIGAGMDLPIGSRPLGSSSPSRRPSILLPIRLRRGNLRLDLFSAITTLGTPLDVTAQELRVESFFPADAASERRLRKIVGAGSSVPDCTRRRSPWEACSSPAPASSG